MRRLFSIFHPGPERRASLWHDRSGAVALLFGLLLIPLIGFVGLAVDSLVLFMVEGRMQRALDAAGLAAGRAGNEDLITSEASAFFHANMGEAASFVDIGALSAVYLPEDERISLSVSGSVPTYFMRILGWNETELQVATVIDLAVRQMELVLVMDNTGSMQTGGKINAMKDAARMLVNIVTGNRENNPNLWMGVVPYVASVNIGAHRASWLSPWDRVFSHYNPFSPTSWKGCVMARSSPRDENDDPPSAAAFTSFFYPSDSDNPWPPVEQRPGALDAAQGPNLSCGPAITSLRQSRSDILTAIEDMQPWTRGGTTGNLGLVWGWRVLSPRWRGLWGGATPNELPLDYDQPDHDKVVVMLTDGDNMFYDQPPSGPRGSDFTAYGRLHDFGYWDLDAARDELDRRMARICAAMKTEGIILYTITFGPTPNEATQSLYRTCATSPEHYFHSPDNADLSSAFRAIGRQLATLRLAR